MENSRGQSTIERVFLHIVQAITVAGFIGGYVTLTDLKSSNAILEIKIENITQRLQDFKISSKESYSLIQAAKDLNPIIEKTSDHEDRIRVLERQLMNGKFFNK